MRQITKKTLCLLLVLAMAFSLFACGEDGGRADSITIDENGIASWESVEGAVQYEYMIVDSDHTSLGSNLTTETTAALPAGKCIHMRPVFADGATGEWIVSEFFGTPSLWPDSEINGEINASDVPAITIDANGYASWESVEGAERYECYFADASHSFLGEPVLTQETSIRVPFGCRLEVRAIFADGSLGDRVSSDFFGEVGEEYDPGDYVDRDFDLPWTEVKRWNLVENIDYSTVQQTADGGVTFCATAPNGSQMRFVGSEGIYVSEGVITLSTGSRLTALDSIGRICAYEPIVSDFGDGDVVIEFRGGYTFSGETSVDSVDALFHVWGYSIPAVAMENGSYPISAMHTQPNMIGIGAGDSAEQDEFTLSELIVYYDEATYATPVGELHLAYDFYGVYLEGDFYEPAKEVYDPSAENYTFYLMLMPKLLNERKPLPDFMNDLEAYMPRAVIDIPQDRYTIGNLKDAKGNILDKSAAAISVGSTLEITLCGTTYDLELPVLERAGGAQMLSELAPYSNAFSKGDVTTLVVPIRWSDLPDEANDEVLELVRAKLGRIVDDSGNVTDYSPDPYEGYSLSAYYDIASYGAYRMESYMTDWVDAPYPYAQMCDVSPLSDTMTDEIIGMVRTMYPNMDWSRFDRNADGILDSVIFISANGNQNAAMYTYGGAAHHSRGYTAERAGTPSRPNLKNFISIGSGMLSSKNVLIHEYAHAFGIVDYYDVTYSGVDAVGGYDLQSQNHGDWNAYSKYAVGWIEPEAVTALESGEYVDITIGVMSETGDAIVIPAAGSEFDGPFGEYILVDLFADCGVNQYDADAFGLAGVTGVRIYHVNSNMEHRTIRDIYGDEYNIGTIHYGNDYKESGKYLIELLQNGGKNQFTDKKKETRYISSDDFFYAGDSFDAKDYGEFLAGGRMDDRCEFGYTIKVVSITGNGADAQAVVRITRK